MPHQPAPEPEPLKKYKDSEESYWEAAKSTILRYTTPTGNTSILQDRLKYTEKRLRRWQLLTAGVALVNIIILYKVFL